jgi:hypothetical protein
MPLYREIPYIGPPRSHTGNYPKYGITVHSTENDAPARNEALYAKNRTDGVSSHFYVDDGEIIQSLNTDYGAHHVGSTYGNRHLISYEFIGKASWSTSRWIDNIDFDAAAAQMARDCQRWNIPARRLSVSMLRNHERGICTHNDCRLALGGTDHTDPGSNFPMTLLIDKVAALLNGDDVSAKDVWTYDPNKLGEGGVANIPGRHDFPENVTVTPSYALHDAWRRISELQAENAALRALIEQRFNDVMTAIQNLTSGGATAAEVKKLVGEDLLDDNS